MRDTLRMVLSIAGAALLAATLGAAPAAAADNGNTIVVDGSTTVEPIAKAFAEYYMAKNEGVNITVRGSGSSNGAKSLIAGTCHVADMSRFMKDKEFKAAVEKGINPVAHVVAMDGIAIVVHKSNPVTELTVEQVRDIYMNKITSWKQLGGPDKKIVKVSRDTSSGTFETFHGLVMHKEKIVDAETVASNSQARQRVLGTPAAIGYVGLGYIKDLKPLEINGVTPNLSTVASGKFPVSRPLYMFTNGYPKLGTHLHSFVTLHLSKRGQEIVLSSGFVPVTQY